MHLQSLSERIRIIPGPVNIGVILLGGNRVALIDSGIDEQYGKRVLKLLSDFRYQVKFILNTHAHADHIGANRFIQEKSECLILASPKEIPAIENPLIQAVALFGGAPIPEIINRFTVAQPSRPISLDNRLVKLDDLEVSVIDLPGHSIDQKGFLVDGVAFVADAMFKADFYARQKLVFLYDPIEYMQSVRSLKEVKADIYVGGHMGPQTNIDALVAENIRQTQTALDNMLKLLNVPQQGDRLVKEFLKLYDINRSGWEFFILRATVNSYLSALKRHGKIDFRIIDNLLVWYAK